MADYEIPEDCRFTKEDEWIRGDAGKVTIGVTDFAQQQLGDIVFVELPAVGDTITQGDSFGVIESVKAVSDLFAPISGEVLEVNGRLEETPELVNEGCYGDGWMLAVAPSKPDELAALMDPAAYRASVAERAD